MDAILVTLELFKFRKFADYSLKFIVYLTLMPDGSGVYL